ncbi:MAG: DUF1648 domain-containing protein [Oscillospiraceae bacterium]|nr:DUF1648 domain-containing protein [Oscillospiraceae bacterium]
MKKDRFYLIAGLTTLIPLILTFVLLPIAPDKIPAHYNADNIVDRWGSKYELLILPIVTVFIFLMMYAFHKIFEFIGQSKESAVIFKVSTICVLIVFYTMNIFFTYASVSQTGNLSQILIIWSIAWIILCLITIVIYFSKANNIK